jgi:poly(hydroxyalkanoate) granule-associated protein
MVKKLQKKTPAKKAAPSVGFNPAALLDHQVAANVRDSAQQIWAAGLAAFSKAQGEGSKVFESLVKEGMTLQKKTQSLAEQKFNAVANKMTGMAGDVGVKAGQHWDKLESIFEERVSKALKSLGVPSGADIGSLISRIDALSAAVGFAPAKKSSVAKKAAPVAKKVAAKAEGRCRPGQEGRRQAGRRREEGRGAQEGRPGARRRKGGRRGEEDRPERAAQGQGRCRQGRRGGQGRRPGLMNRAPASSPAQAWRAP